MRNLKEAIRGYSKHILAFTVIIVLFAFSRLPVLSATEREAIASRFQFTRFPLPEVAGEPYHQLRQVNPSLERHSGWISAVGAAVALNDLDGDGLDNDVCYVEPRNDQVIVAPVPGTGDRYKPFTLSPINLAYDAVTMAPMGCLPGDMNEDGAMDLLVYYWGRTPVAFLNSEVGRGGFLAKIEDSTQINEINPPLHIAKIEDSTQINGINSPLHKGEKISTLLSLNSNSYEAQDIVFTGDKWYTNAATFSDLDGDGHNDLIIGNYFRDNSEIIDPDSTKIEEMQDSMTRAYNGGTNRVLLWQENPENIAYKDVKGIFDQQTLHGWTLGVGTADLDGDLLPEIYFANDFGPDRLLHNRSVPGKIQFAVLQGKKGFTTPNSKVLGHDSFKGMSVDFGDINHDGLLDIYVSNIADEYALEESHFLFTSTGEYDKMKKGIAPYKDQSEPLGVSRSGWGWETKFADFDNDGELEALQATGFRKGEVYRWPELHELALSNDQLLKVSNSWFKFQDGDDLSGHQHNPFFVRAGDGRYYDLAPELGLDEPYVTRGIATADVDGDGDLDFVFANQWDDSYFYRNDSHDTGAFLDLKLLRYSNASISEAIGASVTVGLPDGRKLVAQVDGGNGHSGVRSSRLHFGLGKVSVDAALPVEVQWRDIEGQPQHTSLLLSPGSHTVRLGETTKIASSKS
ncbi:CRTAC1 family protein [Aphanothece sacrum]|uniref:ASPIC/UnbV domain protein n=1 Tax=Aphanothece sacrum FPU1 TaxID=1920663 RepID=A0A401IGC9_APHSA|nr:CRTAC1 family protein [Aphanothece sacrum]GBF80269.1 ASPIC/UnbV domain protein [Aphanothece sacrum FPU1]GBF83674.1 ASPIC/UnbV domain protein [Aphanothece sacrum FPU3]